MRVDIQTFIKQYPKEERCLLNKSEMVRRFNCDSRTIARHLKMESGELIHKKSNRKYSSVLDDYKSIIIDKIDVHGATAMAVYKVIL